MFFRSSLFRKKLDYSWILNHRLTFYNCCFPNHPIISKKINQISSKRDDSQKSMGFGLFTKKNLKKGELIFEEEPLLYTNTVPLQNSPYTNYFEPFSYEIPNEISNSHPLLQTVYQFFKKCSSKNQIREFFENYSFETPINIPNHIKNIIDNMSYTEKKIFEKNDHTRHDIEMIFWFLNNYGHTNFSSLFDIPVGFGLWPQSSLFNHSCQPNCLVYHYRTTLRVTALKNISQGEELSISYISLSPHAYFKHRQSQLFQLFGFHCYCDKCNSEIIHNPPEPNPLGTLPIKYAKIIADIAQKCHKLYPQRSGLDLIRCSDKDHRQFERALSSFLEIDPEGSSILKYLDADVRLDLTMTYMKLWYLQDYHRRNKNTLVPTYDLTSYFGEKDDIVPHRLLSYYFQYILADINNNPTIKQKHFNNLCDTSLAYYGSIQVLQTDSDLGLINLKNS